MTSLPTRLLICAASLLAVACTSTGPVAPLAPAPGSTKASAIEVCMPPGERAYLSRLRCPDGSPPTYRRSGNVGPRHEVPEQGAQESDEAYHQRVWASAPTLQGAPLGPGQLDLHIIDVYQLSCGQAHASVYLDMYHCPDPRPMQAPPGFSVVSPKD